MRMKKTTKRTNQNTTTPGKRAMAKDVDTTGATAQRKSKKNEKAKKGKNSGENDQAENFNYINSYLTEIFELAKSDDSVSSKGDAKLKGAHKKGSELGETISRLHTKSNSLNVEWEQDNTYEFETMESGGYPNGAPQLGEAGNAVEVADVVKLADAVNGGEATSGASFSGGCAAHTLRLKKALASGDERDYNIYGSKSLFNHFGSFNRNGNAEVWSTNDQENYNSPKGKSVQNGVGMNMAQGRGDLPIDDLLRGGNFHMLEEGAFHMGGSSGEQESDGVTVDLLLEKLGCSSGHVGGVEPVQTGKPQELNKNLLQLLSSSNREFVCDYIRKYREMGERGEGTSDEGRMQGQNDPRFDGYEKGKSVCFDLPTSESSIMLNGHSTEVYVKSDRGSEAGNGSQLESSRSIGENTRPSGEERVERSGGNVNQDNCVEDGLGGMAHPAHTYAEEYKEGGYEQTDSNAPSLFFTPEWVRTDQGETCMQGGGLEKGGSEGKRGTATPPNHVAPADEWNAKTPLVGPNVKECTTSELYNNLLELLNDGSQNVKVDDMNHEMVVHAGEGLISGETAAYYHGDILKHLTLQGGRDSHLDDLHSGGNHTFTHRPNYEEEGIYAKGLSGVGDDAKRGEVERGVTMGNISSAALPGKSYLKYPTAPFPILHNNSQGNFRSGGQSTHGSPHTVAKKKNVLFEALKNKIGFLLDNEDDEVLLSQYITDAIGEYNRSKWGRGASGRGSMQVGRPSFGEGAGLVYNPIGGAPEIAAEMGLQNRHTEQSIKDSIHKSETSNYHCSGEAEQLSEVGRLPGQHHRHNASSLLGRAHTDTYNDRYSQMDRVRGGSPPQGAAFAAIREDSWRADNFGGGRPHVRNGTQRSSIANLRLFLESSLAVSNVSNSREAIVGAGLAVEAGTPTGHAIDYINGNTSNYTSGHTAWNTIAQRNGLGKGSLRGDSAFGPNGDAARGGWNVGPVSSALPVPIATSDAPVKALDGRNSANVGSSHRGDHSIERGDAMCGHLRAASKEENNEEGKEENDEENSEETSYAQLRKLNENLFLLSRRNGGSLRCGALSRVSQAGSAVRDGSANGYVAPLPGGNSLMRIPEGEHRDDGLAPKGDNSFLKRGSSNLTMHRAFGVDRVSGVGVGGGGSDALSGAVGSFQKGHFIDEAAGSNWSSWNFKGRERDIEEAKREGTLFGGRRGDPSLSSRGKGAFEDTGDNSLWNRNLAASSSAARASYSGFLNRANGAANHADHLGGCAPPRSGSGIGSGISSGIGMSRNNHGSNGRMDRPKAQERRGVANTRGKKKSVEARDQLSAQDLKACLSKEDEQDLEHLLSSLYDDRIIPLIINLKGRADEYNLRDVIKNNIRNAYGLFPEKYTVQERCPSASASPTASTASSASPTADDWLVHFVHRAVDADYFFSINDSVDRYDPALWNQFEKYLGEIASSDDPQMYSFTGGRYGMAKELQRRKLPFFQGLYLGHLCHIVHISATRKIIAYENNFIKPISRCRKYEDAKMGLLNTRGGSAHNYIASMEELKFYLGAILSSYKRGINISTLKGKIMSNYNKRLCESVFHCVKLVELLQLEELRDVCVVDLDSRVLRAAVADAR
ncbi:conserved Plasmodium protein, unknown function [Plasmodium vivax]|nr:conserved Plasmodium protein, unknown function [Plasmodium vivax]